MITPFAQQINCLSIYTHFERFANSIMFYWHQANIMNLSTGVFMRMENVTIKPEAFTSKGAQYLIAMLENDLKHRYIGQSINAAKPAKFEHEKSLFLVARKNGEPIGCGGLVYVDEETCEIKRMFVEPHSRGCGIAKKILLVLEEYALEKGFKEIQLETGQHQPEAIVLYEHSGYTRIPCFRQFDGNPHSHCYEKKIVYPCYSSHYLL